MTQSDTDLKRILQNTRCIAMVGVSPNPVRPSYFVARFLRLRGYRIIPVNPVAVGQQLFGEHIYGDLSEIPGDIAVDMVDVFRRADFVPEIYAAAQAHLPQLRTLWMQIGVTHTEITAQAESDGIEVVQDRCPKMEFQRLFGELRKAGINTGVLSSRLPEIY